MYLADLGADVLRIEAPNRPDIVRISPPYVEDNISAAHATLNRSKRSLALNLKHPDAPSIVKRLVKDYDIVIEQFRPGVMDRLGVGYESLKAENPRLIYCAITGYGQTGPYASRAGHDSNYLALAGIMSYSGRQDTGPHPHGAQIADIGGGSFGAMVGILAAVIHRQLTGEGQLIDVSMTDGALAWNAVTGAEYLGGAELPTYENRLLNGGSHYNYYRTADGRYLSVSSLEPQFWHGFCEAIERPDLIDQVTKPGEGMRPIREEIAKVIACRTLADWEAFFEQVDVCVEAVLTLDEVVEHPLTQAREMVVDVKGEKGSTRQIANPLKLSKTPPEYRYYGVALGHHTQEVMSELGFTEAEIQGFAESGMFGQRE
jgi:crotonobetainyl-CoA:carnitine CoA-transferase CaiB-like acyl-CoA transferase